MYVAGNQMEMLKQLFLMSPNPWGYCTQQPPQSLSAPCVLIGVCKRNAIRRSIKSVLISLWIKFLVKCVTYRMIVLRTTRVTHLPPDISCWDEDFHQKKFIPPVSVVVLRCDSKTTAETSTYHHILLYGLVKLKIG